MRIVIITIAGVSSRFNEGIPENKKSHKIIYYEQDMRNTLLYHLLEKCSYADKIILVGGSRFEEVKEYCNDLPLPVKEKVILVYNEHYNDLASGYSLYVGLDAAFVRFVSIDDIVFVEGDLDIDTDSFNKVINAEKDVLTYSYEPIFSNKAVVLYRDEQGRYRYAFNSSHGLLMIEEPFSMILNSGQTWKFTNIDDLKTANDRFFKENKDGTNLRIIQNYIDLGSSDGFELIGLSRWTNCNTRDDYHKILKIWEKESNENTDQKT